MAMRPPLPLLSLLLVLLLAGCASPGPRVGDLGTDIATPPAGMGRIVFYRIADPLLVAVSADMIVNDRRVGTLEAGEVFFRDARPGRYRVFSTHDPDGIVDFAIAAGETRYLRVAPGVYFPGFRLGVELVEAPRAEAEVAGLTLASGGAPQ